MASRKKQDERNMKLLRDLASLQHNKYCFDCNQRGPTYVNVTIGSFVCTKCSGILRGLTPPHRVKSISMATFTPEEIELLRNKGNSYCRRTWLGLYEGNLPSDSRDEQVVRDFMVDKYERKRYYLEPSTSLTNGVDTHTSNQSNKVSEVKLTANLVIQPKLPQVNGASSEKNNKNVNGKMTDFIADFGSADIYNAVNASKDNNINNNAPPQAFANFENNLIFNSNVESASCKIDDWGFTNFDTAFDQTPLFPKCNVNNHWNPFLPMTSSCSSQNLDNERSWITFENQGASTFNTSGHKQFNTTGPPAPPEDRYAALKDLDNALKVQPQIDWNSGSNSSYGSVTPASSVYSSPSPHGSMYGSPSQGQFASMFSQQDMANVSNPFNGFVWGDSGNQLTAGVAANPFRSSNASNVKVNGVSSSFCATPAFPSNNGSPWVPNPFSMGSSASNGHSSNPFL